MPGTRPARGQQATLDTFWRCSAVKVHVKKEESEVIELLDSDEEEDITILNCSADASDEDDDIVEVPPFKIIDKKSLSTRSTATISQPTFTQDEDRKPVIKVEEDAPSTPMHAADAEQEYLAIFGSRTQGSDRKQREERLQSLVRARASTAASSPVKEASRPFLTPSCEVGNLISIDDLVPDGSSSDELNAFPRSTRTSPLKEDRKRRLSSPQHRPPQKRIRPLPFVVIDAIRGMQFPPADALTQEDMARFKPDTPYIPPRTSYRPDCERSESSQTLVDWHITGSPRAGTSNEHLSDMEIDAPSLSDVATSLDIPLFTSPPKPRPGTLLSYVLSQQSSSAPCCPCPAAAFTAEDKIWTGLMAAFTPTTQTPLRPEVIQGKVGAEFNSPIRKGRVRGKRPAARNGKGKARARVQDQGTDDNAETSEAAPPSVTENTNTNHWPTAIDWEDLRRRVRGNRGDLQAKINDPKTTYLFEDMVRKLPLPKNPIDVVQYGYLGPRGAKLIYEELKAMFGDIGPGLCKPLTPDDFLYTVLVPEVALYIMARDITKDWELAKDTLLASRRHGQVHFPLGSR